MTNEQYGIFARLKDKMAEKDGDYSYFLHQLSSPSEERRKNAVRVISANGKDCIEELVAAFHYAYADNPNKETARDAVLEIILRIGKPAIPILAKNMCELFSKTYVEALIRFGKEAVPELLDRLSRGQQQAGIHSNALDALFEIADRADIPEAIPPLIQRLKGSWKPEHKPMICSIFGRIGKRTYSGQIIDALIESITIRKEDRFGFTREFDREMEKLTTKNALAAIDDAATEITHEEALRSLRKAVNSVSYGQYHYAIGALSEANAPVREKPMKNIAAKITVNEAVEILLDALISSNVEKMPLAQNALIGFGGDAIAGLTSAKAVAAIMGFQGYNVKTTIKQIGNESAARFALIAGADEKEAEEVAKTMSLSELAAEQRKILATARKIFEPEEIEKAEQKFTNFYLKVAEIQRGRREDAILGNGELARLAIEKMKLREQERAGGRARIFRMQRAIA